MKKTLLLALVSFLSGCGLLFVNGPPSGWQEIQDPDQLETMAITQPCTTGKGVLLLDGLMGGMYASYGVAAATSDYTAIGLVFLGAAAPFLAGAGVGNQKVNNCRAFNARVFELRRGGASSLTSYEWLDDLFPLPDLGVTGLDPIFGVPIN
jgi:hypothetical protein